jgi:DNA invertase Pin-like site-specific DNA recombinase
MKRAALYARVSTRNGHQDPETQLLALRQVAEHAGWRIVGEYVDPRHQRRQRTRQAAVFRSAAQPKLPPSVERSIQAARAAGKGQLAIARELRVGVDTVRRVLGLK